MIKHLNIFLIATLALAAMICLTGCVERLITVKTQPSGALVYLNGEEVGASPVTVSFTWYGTYDVVARKTGYQTLNTTQKIDAPFYQWPPLDLFTECFLPLNLVDRHELTFNLEPQTPTDPDALIDRAKSLQQQTIITPDS